MCHDECFHPSLLHFFFDWWMKGEKSLKRCWWIVQPAAYTSSYTYYVMLMAKCMCTWLHHSLKLLPSTMFLLCTDSRQPGWLMLRLMCTFLGHNLPIQLLLKLLSSMYDGDRLIYHFHHVPIHITIYKYVTLHAWTNRLTHFSICNLPIQLLLCVTLLFTSAWQQA